MTDKEYQDKKRECWENIKFALRAPNTDRKTFDFIFDRAYALGKQEIKQETDAEGEEMLTVSRKKIQKVYRQNKEEINRENVSSSDKDCYETVNEVLKTLFGSKCLPDDTKNDTKEPKPAEPKFNLGDIVRFKYCCATYRIDGFKMSDGVMLYQVGEVWAEESDLEPYTEPSKVESATLHAESVEESRNASEESNLSNSSQDCDEWFDTIIKRGFRADRRCNIAVQMIKAMMGCPEIIDRISSAEADSLLDDILHDAPYLTDNLIAECRKGGSL